MPSQIDSEQVQQQAKRLLEQRLQVIPVLTETRQGALAAMAADADAYAAAITAGWSAEELGSLGFAPLNAAGKAPMRRRRRGGSPAAAPSTPTRRSKPAEAPGVHGAEGGGV